MDDTWALALLSTVAAAAVGLMTWWIQVRREENRRERGRLFDERRPLYLQVIRPFVLILSKSGQKEGVKLMLSTDHLEAVREFSLIGSDKAVAAVNALMQYGYQNTEGGVLAEPEKMLALLGNVFLEMRKELGSPKTKLTVRDMFKYQITDIEQWDL